MQRRLLKLRLFPDSYIKNFIAVSILLTVAFLLIFNSLFYSFAVEKRKENFLHKHTVHAQVLASHLSAALGADEFERADRLIHEELSYESTLGMYLYNASGVLLCGFYDGQEASLLPHLGEYEHRIEMPIYFQDNKAGTLVSIVTFLPDHHHFLSLFLPFLMANVTATCLLVIMVIVFIVRTLLRPLRELSKTARRVREEQTYTVRAKRKGMGELAELTDSFNSMLDHIEAHDMFRLSESRNLEKQVLERTKELEKATQAAKAATTAKSEFIASVSHELRTPMNAILGMTNMLQTTELTGKQREYAEIIAAASQNLLHLVNGVLDLSKLEAQKLEIEETTFVLRDVLDELSVIFTEKVAVKEMDLVVVVDESVPPVMRGDSFRLKQILLNLVGNAFKFADRGAVELRVSVDGTAGQPIQMPHVKDSDEIVRLAFSVKDKGIGIAEDAQQKLFDTFVQADGSTSRQYGGTGLGLSIVAELVSLMGGSISVDSAVGKGSTFLAVLPFVVADDCRKTMLPVFSGRRVLVLEPSITARTMWRNLFTELGMLVVVLGTESQVLRQLEDASVDSSFDLVVLGSKELLDMTGELINYLCRHTAHKVVLASRLGDETLPDRSCPLEVTAFLRRPVTLSQVKLIVLRALSPDKLGQLERSMESLALEGLSVLVVEDNPINQQVMREILEYLGVDVTIAKDGISALELLSVYTYDMVLMDIQLPGMDGFETTNRLREELELTSLPVIAMTAHTMQEDRDKAADAGMNGYLTKPVELDELIRTLRRYGSGKMQSQGALLQHGSVQGTDSLEEGAGAIRSGNSQEMIKNEEQPVTAMNTDDEPQLPEELPGLDIAEGLQRLNGKRGIYLKVLKTFVHRYAGTAEELRALYLVEDWAGLAAKAHTLAGASGNVSAKEVHARCEKLEQEAKRRNVDALTLKELEAALETACRSMKSLLE